MTTYSVSLPAMNNCISDMDSIGKNITNLLDDLETSCQQTLASWTGESQTYYWAAKRQWDAAAQHMPAALATATSTLQQIAEEYLRAERAGVQTFGG